MRSVSKLRETLEITSAEASPAIYLTGSWQPFLQKSQSVLSANWACVSTAEIKRLQLPTEMSSPGTAVKHKSKGRGTQTSRSCTPPTTTTSTTSVQKQSLALTAVCFILSAGGWMKTNGGLIPGSLPWFLSTCLLFVHSHPFIRVPAFLRRRCSQKRWAQLRQILRLKPVGLSPLPLVRALVVSVLNRWPRPGCTVWGSVLQRRGLTEMGLS